MKTVKAWVVCDKEGKIQNAGKSLLEIRSVKLNKKDLGEGETVQLVLIVDASAVERVIERLDEVLFIGERKRVEKIIKEELMGDGK